MKFAIKTVILLFLAMFLQSMAEYIAFYFHLSTGWIICCGFVFGAIFSDINREVKNYGL